MRDEPVSERSHVPRQDEQHIRVPVPERVGRASLRDLYVRIKRRTRVRGSHSRLLSIW